MSQEPKELKELRQLFTGLKRRVKQAATSARTHLQETLETAADLTEDAIATGRKELHKLAEENPELKRGLEAIRACGDHLAHGLDAARAHFDTDLEIQISQDPTRPYRLHRTDADNITTTTSKDYTQLRVIFFGNRLLSGQSRVVLRSSDGAEIELSCDAFHTVGMTVRSADESVPAKSLQAKIGTGVWLLTSGPRGEQIKITRIRHQDFSLTKPTEFKEDGPGRFRSIRFVDPK